MSDVRPGPLTLTRKLGARIRSRGPGEVVAEAKTRISELAGTEVRLVFLTRPILPVEADAGPAPEGLRFFRGGPEHARLYARDIGTDSPRTFRQRLDDLTSCWLIWSPSKPETAIPDDEFAGGLIVHSTWSTTALAWTREIHRYFRVPPGDAYVYESFTRPEVRGRGAYPFALRSIAAAFAHQNVERLWVGVEADNHASLRAVAKAGFEPGFEISCRRRWGAVLISEPSGPLARLASDIIVSHS